MSGGGGNETRVHQLFYWDDDMKVEEQGGGRGKARVSSMSKGKYVRYLSP